MKRSFVALALGLVPALWACQTLPPNPATFNFDRPADVELLCLDVAETSNGHIATADRNNAPLTNPVLRVRSIDDPACSEQNLATITNQDMRADETSPTGFSGSRLFAVVTQSDRGELAVVNLHREFETGIVDNDRAVPGYTFIPVGSFPGAVSVDPRGVATYVANTGESTVTVIDNTTLLASPTDVNAPRIEHRYARDGSPGVYVSLVLPGRPSDVQSVKGADGKYYVYATVPLEGVVAVFDVTDPGAPVTLPPIMLRGVGPGAGLDGGAGGFDAGAGDLDAGAEGGAGTGTPTPEQFAYDGQGHLYVSDRGLGIVHVLGEPAGGGPFVEGDALLSNAPTRAITVTPLVRSTDPRVDNHRFVYAVDARDGSLMVLDADPALAAAGPLLVNTVAGRADCERATFDSATCARLDPKVAFDRVPLVGPARVLSVVTREGVDDTDCVTGVLAAPVCSANPTGGDPGPSVLRGVQVVAGIRSGQMQIIDVEDPDRDCPGRRATPGHPPFQPHTLRANLAFGADPTLSGPPTYLVNGATTTPGPDQPQLAPLSGQGACDATNNYCVQLPVIPGGDGGVNAYAVRPDTWTITYEGPLPGLSVDTGSFRVPPAPYDPATTGNDGLIQLDSPGTGFCTLGALPGDHVLITRTSPFVPDTSLPDASVAPPQAPANCPSATAEFCGTLFGDTAAPRNREMIVVAADQDRLVLQTVPPADMSAAAFVQNIQCCFPEATPFEVRPTGAWTVVGLVRGYQHNVHEAGGSCVADPAVVPTGRLVTGQPYHSNDFDLLINPGVLDGQPQPPARGDTYQFATTNGYTPLVLAGGLLPGAMHYFCRDRRLYIVDQSRNSLDEYNVQPISTPRSFN